MTSVIVASNSVAVFAEGGGHFWVFLQWIRGLQRNGCEVHWLECTGPKYGRQPDERAIDTFLANAARFGLADVTLVCSRRADGSVEFLNVAHAAGQAVLDRADLLVDFKYDLPEAILAAVRRRALVDIDPGQLQFWMAHGQLDLPEHDIYFTTGERVGGDGSRDGELTWHEIRPVVDTESWAFDTGAPGEAYTSVTNWFGEWLTDGGELLLDNSKRIEFLKFVDLPQRAAAPLELAVCFGDEVEDEIDRKRLLASGWRVRHSFEAAGDPVRYRDYVRQSRGEFSCVKPSCLLFGNAWISDRTLCYLASGRPAVVQHTGASSYLPDAEGLFRFHDLDGAAAALEEAERRYEHHRHAARELAVAHFDAAAVSARVLDLAL